jgi:hypothetical protein
MSYEVERTICAEGAHASRGRKRENALTACGLLQPDLVSVFFFDCVTHKIHKEEK